MASEPSFVVRVRAALARRGNPEPRDIQLLLNYACHGWEMATDTARRLDRAEGAIHAATTLATGCFDDGHYCNYNPDQLARLQAALGAYEREVGSG